MPDRIRSTNLLLLPGMMCHAGLWQHQEREFAGEYRLHHGVISQDDQVSGIAAAVLEEAPASFALAGLSMGGIVAMEMWRQAPARIERMALLDTNFRPDTAQRKTMRNRQINEVRQGKLGALLKDELKPNYLAACHRRNTALLDEVLEMGLTLGEDVFERQSLALRDRPDSSVTLAEISCPTLVLCGDEDSLCSPELHREMASMIPGATLEIIQNCGHLSTMEQPQAVNNALRAWLTI